MDTAWIVPDLSRLGDELVMKVASLMKRPNDDCEWFKVDIKENLIYCRYDSYLWNSRTPILRLLLTGFVRKFILHCYHVGDNTRNNWLNRRRWAFDEVQDLIDRLPSPRDTEFVIDCVGI